MNFRQEFWQFTGAIAIWIATGVLGPFLLSRIPAVRIWFAKRPWVVSCVVAFFISGAMAAIVGNIVSNDFASLQSTESSDLAKLRSTDLAELKKSITELNESKFAIIAGGRIEANGHLQEEFGLQRFKVEKQGEGKYRVKFDKALERIPFIVVGAPRGGSDTSAPTSEAAISRVWLEAFTVQTSLNKQPKDEEFWFLAIHPTLDPNPAR